MRCSNVRPMRRVFLQPSKKARVAAALLECEELLSEEARHVTGASYRRRVEIEEELAEVRRLLEQLGFGRDLA